jgi:predicted ABC-type ATPase
MSELYIVAGPNGAGKTTLFKKIIPEGVDYINADAIAKTIREKAGGLNVQDIANRETAEIFSTKVRQRESFSIETNLADVDTYKSFIALKALGYRINLVFLSVDDINTCIARVAQRVAQGGHNVNPDVIRARYETGLKLLAHYKNDIDR